MPCDLEFFRGFLAEHFVVTKNQEFQDRVGVQPGMAMTHRHSIAADCVPDWLGRQYMPTNVGGANLAHGLYNWCCNYHGQTPGGGRAPCQQAGVQILSNPFGAVYCRQTAGHGGSPTPPGLGYGACPAMCGVEFEVFKDCGVGEDVGYDFGLEVNNSECGIPPGIFVQWNTPVDGDIIQFPTAKTEYYQCCSGISKTFFDANGPYVVEIALRWRTDNCQTAIYCLGIEVRITRESNPALQCVVRNAGEFGIPWDCYSPAHHAGEPASGFWEGPVEFPPPEGDGQIWLLYDTETQQEAGWFIFRRHEND